MAFGLLNSLINVGLAVDNAVENVVVTPIQAITGGVRTVLEATRQNLPKIAGISYPGAQRYRAGDVRIDRSTASWEPLSSIDVKAPYTGQDTLIRFI